MMKKLLSFIIFTVCVSLTTAVYAGSLYGSLGGRGSLYGSLGGGSFYGNLGPSGSNLYGSLGSSGSRHNGGGYKGSKYHKGNSGHYRGYGYYGGGIAAGYIGTPAVIEYIPQPVYYLPAPVYYELAPVPETPAPATVATAPIPEAPVPVTVVTTSDNVSKGHFRARRQIDSKPDNHPGGCGCRCGGFMGRRSRALPWEVCQSAMCY